MEKDSTRPDDPESLKSQIEIAARILYDVLREYQQQTSQPYAYTRVSPDMTIVVAAEISPKMENLRWKTNEVPYFVCDKCKQKPCICERKL